ncbi:MAG: hypothetical protein JSW06_03755, partial [Thermoplasmatales archaeon]
MKKRIEKKLIRNDFFKKTIVLGVVLIFVASSICTANIYLSNEIIPNATIPALNVIKENRAIEWDVQLNFAESGGKTNWVIFGEAPDANDGPPPDNYDTPWPPGQPQPPYILPWFDDGLPPPYQSLWSDYRRYPDINKIWNLTVQWVPIDSVTPTNITISWNTNDINNSEYGSIHLYDGTGTTFLRNMSIQNNYTFHCPAWVPQNFRIICIVNQAPNVSDIPNQTIAEGESFATIPLDDYVSDPDNLDSEMTWTYSGNVDLTVSIDVNRVAT